SERWGGLVTNGTNGTVGSGQGQARSHMQTRNHAESNSTALTSSDTAGRSSTRQEGGAIAHQIGESEALARGTDRSITRGNTVTNSLQTTDGFSDSVGHTSSHGIA